MDRLNKYRENPLNVKLVNILSTLSILSFAGCFIAETILIPLYNEGVFQDKSIIAIPLIIVCVTWILYTLLHACLMAYLPYVDVFCCSLTKGLNSYYSIQREYYYGDKKKSLLEFIHVSGTVNHITKILKLGYHYHFLWIVYLFGVIAYGCIHGDFKGKWLPTFIPAALLAALSLLKIILDLFLSLYEYCLVNTRERLACLKVGHHSAELMFHLIIQPAIIIELVLIAKKMDGGLDKTSWGTIFIPLYIIIIGLGFKWVPIGWSYFLNKYYWKEDVKGRELCIYLLFPTIVIGSFSFILTVPPIIFTVLLGLLLDKIINISYYSLFVVLWIGIIIYSITFLVLSSCYKILEKKAKKKSKSIMYEDEDSDDIYDEYN